MVSPQFVSNFLLAWRSNLSSFRDSSGSSQKAGAEKAKMKGVPQNLFFRICHCDEDHVEEFWISHSRSDTYSI